MYFTFLGAFKKSSEVHTNTYFICSMQLGFRVQYICHQQIYWQIYLTIWQVKNNSGLRLKQLHGRYIFYTLASKNTKFEK